MHLASPASPPAYLQRPIETLDVGSLGTRNLLELARHHGARFFLVSTSEVYGDPLVHPRSFCYVDDEISGFLALLDSSITGAVNIGNPAEFTMLELAELVLELTGSSSDLVFDELPSDDFADIGEELVAEALTVGGPLDEPTDVDHLDRCVDDLLRLGHDRQAIEAVVGHPGDTDVRVFRGERIGRSERTPARECVVERRLTRVGQSDKTEAFHEASQATDPSARPSRRPGRRGGVLARAGDAEVHLWLWFVPRNSFGPRKSTTSWAARPARHDDGRSGRYAG